MVKRTFFLILSGILFSIFGQFTLAYSFPIVKSGKPMAVIVVPVQASAVIQYAAAELQMHIEKATQVKLKIITDKEQLGGFRAVYIGYCRQAKLAGLKVQELEPNAFLMKTTDKAIFLVGKDGAGIPPLDDSTLQGSLFAVYEWLERQLKVKWLWPGELGTVVPSLNMLDSGPVASQSIKPKLLHSRFRLLTGDWTGFGEPARKRYVEENNKWLRRHRFVRPVNLDYGHAFNDYWTRYGKNHPEYFALRTDGRREPFDGRTELVQLCVSNKNLHKQIIADWLQYRTPDKGLINGNENDKRESDQSCYCDSCKAWDAKTTVYVKKNPWLSGVKVNESDSVTSKSDRYAKFYLALQAEAEKYDKDARLIGLAYADYTEPPLETRLNNRIFIRMVPAFQFPLSNADADAFKNLWTGWAQTNASLILRPNYTLEGYCLPYIYGRQFGAQFKYAVKNGLVATDFDSMTGMWGINGPTLYMIGRLNSNPDLGIEEVLTAYYSGFGKAAATVRSYFDYWESITPVRDENFRKQYPAGGWSAMSVSGHKIYTEARIVAAKKILLKALKLADDDATAKRIKFLGIWLRQAELAVKTLNAYDQYKSNMSSEVLKQDVDKAKQMLDEFRMANLEALGLTNLPFLNKLEKWAGWRK